jgi:hypothetical protein
MTAQQGRISLWWRLALGVLVSVSLCLPALAHAQQKRLDMFWVVNGRIWNQSSLDGGVTWRGDYTQLSMKDDSNHDIFFVGTPAAVSDQAGRLWVVAMGQV